MLTIQADITFIASVIPSVTMVKTTVNSQFEIFGIDNGQPTISLIFAVKLVKVKGTFGAKT